MPEKPLCSARQPIRVDLEPGVYFWCSCGRTSHSPFCDGSHKGTGLQPLRIEVTKKTSISFCQCKASATPPVCDGAHLRL